MQEGAEQKEVALFYVEELHKEPVRIKHIQELAKYQLPLKAKIPGDERSYFTTVEKVAMAKGGEYIVLMKEFENPKYKEKLKVGDKVEFEYSDSVGKYLFESIFKGTYKTSLIFSFPEKIERKAGRSAFRVKPNPAEPIEVSIEFPWGGVFKGNMVDINENGMGLDVEVPKDRVKMMDIVKLAFRLPTKENQKKHEWAIVSAKAEVRFIGDGEQKKTRFGLQFVEISEDDRKSIREYWLMRQREELKRKLEYES
jgi:c-di-GMP-binding flagellar brake protein YcgR